MTRILVAPEIEAEDPEGMRLGGYSFGDRHIEDAYVYRIS
jgi:hypothetical protein